MKVSLFYFAYRITSVHLNIRNEVLIMSEHNHDCGDGCECGHDHEEHMTVTLTLDDDKELECSVLTIFPVKDQSYIALLPMDAPEEEEGEVLLYRFKQLEDDEIDLENIEDDDEYDAVADAFDLLMDDEDIDDLFED